MALRGNMQKYAEGRAAGMDPNTAAAHAGYAPGAGIRVVASRLEARTDVKAEIKRLKRDGVEVDTTVEEPKAGRGEWDMKDKYASPLDLLEDVMNNPNAPKSLRYQAAKDSLPYRPARVAEAGKKEKKEDLARQKSGAGRFSTKRAPQREHHVMN